MAISQLYWSSIHQLKELWVKLWLTIQWHLSFFLMRTNVPTVANKLNYIFLSQLQLSNEKWLSIQHETRPYFNGFPFSCCDDKSLMERYSKLICFYKKKICSLGCINGPLLWKFTSVSVTTWFTEFDQQVLTLQQDRAIFSASCFLASIMNAQSGAI